MPSPPHLLKFLATPLEMSRVVEFSEKNNRPVEVFFIKSCEKSFDICAFFRHRYDFILFTHKHRRVNEEMRKNRKNFNNICIKKLLSNRMGTHRLTGVSVFELVLFKSMVEKNI